MAGKKKTYPHVVDVKDPHTQASLRLLWDLMYTREQDISVANETIRSLRTQLDSISSTATQALQNSLVARTATAAPVTRASNTGPQIPGGGGTVEVPPHAPVTGTVSTTDMLDLTLVTIVNSVPDIATWAQTSTITTFDWNVNGAYIDHTKRDGAGRWPDYLVPGWGGGTLEYTLWIFLNISGTWYGSGFFQYWNDPGNTLRNGGPPSQMMYNATSSGSTRWHPMETYQPAVGEDVGFMVSAGNARDYSSMSSVAERSQTIIVPFFDNAGAVYTS